MHKYLFLSGVAGLALSAFLGISTASADVFVSASIDKTKTVTVSESVAIDKNITLDTTVDLAPNKFAESNALANQTNNNLHVCENCAEKQDALVNSVTGNTGITSVNQAAGNFNNQGSALSVAVDMTFPNRNPAGSGVYATELVAQLRRLPALASVS